jgi:hypothetical protein
MSRSLPTIMPLRDGSQYGPLPDVVIEPEGRAVVACWANGPAYRLDEHGEVTVQHRMPVDRDPDVMTRDEIAEALRGLKLSKVARTAVAAALGLHDDLSGPIR